jgi:hypothetical protein
MNLNPHRRIHYLIQSGQPLSEADQQALQQLLQECPECRAYAQTVEQLGRALPNVVQPRYLTADQIRKATEQLQSRLAPRRARAAAGRTLRRIAWAGAFALVLLGAILLGSGLRSAGPGPLPKPPATTAVVQTVHPSPTSAPTLMTTQIPDEQVPLVLAPEVCSQTVSPEPPAYGLPQRPAGLLGGGSVLNGDFALDLWLVCDPQYNADPDNVAYRSEITGLGFYFAWAYQGSSEDEILTAWGIRPYVDWKAGMSGGPGSGFYDASGLQFPAEAYLDISQPEQATMEFVFKVRSGNEAPLGQALTFTLLRQAEGYAPVDISTRSLSAEELLAWESQPTPTPPFPSLPADQTPTAFGDLQTRLEAWKASLLSAPGWIHQQQRILPGGGTLPNGRSVPDPYIMDEWYQVGMEGKVSAAVNRMQDEAGEVYQVTVYREGAWTNLTFGGDPMIDDLTYDPSLNILREAAEADRLGSGELYFEGRLVGDQFIIIQGDTRLEVLLEPGSGKILSLMTYTILPDGLQFQSSDLIQVQERLDQPPEDILSLLEQSPAAYQPAGPQGTLAPPDYDPSGYVLTMTMIPGDDFYQPSFWFGDLYTEDYLLGCVDFGMVPGGYCDRSADGAKIAYTYSTQNAAGEYIGRLRWLDLRNLQTVHMDLPDIHLLSQVTWSPLDDRLAFSGCDDLSGECRFYVYNTATGELVIAPESDGTGMPVIWKPEGDQVAFLASQPDDSLLLVVIDAASGAILYTAPYDWDADQAVGDVPFNEWGVAFPHGGDTFSGCTSP